MRLFVAFFVVVAASVATAEAAAPVRGAADCWAFDLRGTGLADRLEGTADADHVAAYDGDDELVLFGGADCALGGGGADVLHLGPGDDHADGGDGDDALHGGPGHDVLVAGPGADRADGGDDDDLIRDGRGDADPDVLIGGPGHDVIRAANAGADAVECGPGWDVAIVDAADTLSECDDVHVARRPPIEARTLRTGVRPAFALRWRASDLAEPRRVAVQLLAHPEPSRGCGVGSWRARGSSAVRLSWHGVRGACAGVYAFRLTWVGRGQAGPRREVLGEISLTVL